MREARWYEITNDPATFPPEGEAVMLHDAQINSTWFGSCDYLDEVWLWSLDYAAPEYRSGHWECGNPECDDLHPTHWCPIPQPPSVANSEK